MVNQQQFESVKSKLGLDKIDPKIAEAIIERFGHDLFKKALIIFFQQLGEWEQSSFESWIDTHAGEVDILEQLMLLYPQLGNILNHEILKLAEMSINFTETK